MRVLLLAWGNPAREDDGLGPALAAAVERWGLAGLTISSDYQLQVEDAADVAEHDLVVFVDAATEGAEPFAFTRVQPRAQASFSSHSLRPEALLGLASSCFQRAVPGWLLAIRGYSFAPFVEAPTPAAQANLTAALDFLRGWLSSDERLGPR
ncbi:MAG: hydrogenase maturation protease [Pseudomonadota bacterium]